jgi:tryptophan synthase alpha chain
MNKLTKIFKERQNLLALYFTAGFPELEDFPKVIAGFEASDADILEIGIPFSDPMADGPVIQKSGQRALENGMTVQKLFELLEKIPPGKPKVIMTYINPVFRFGIERFCEMAAKSGIDGMIIPDLPFEEFEREYLEIFRKNNLHYIPLITDKTNDARLEMATRIGSGFIYLASAHIITGSKTGLEFSKEFKDKIMKLQKSLPVMIGFGIRNHDQYMAASNISNGAIIGSAFIQALENSEDVYNETIGFVKEIKGESL